MDKNIWPIVSSLKVAACEASLRNGVCTRDDLCPQRLFQILITKAETERW